MSYIAVCTSLHFTMECSILIRRKVHELILLRFLSLSLSLFLPIRRPIGSLNKILEQTPSKRDRDSMQQRMHRVPSCRQTGSILSVVLVPLFLPASADPFTIPSHCHFHRVSSGTTLESFSRVVVPFKGPPWKTTKFLDHWTVLPSTAQLATSSVPVLHPLYTSMWPMPARSQRAIWSRTSVFWHSIELHFEVSISSETSARPWTQKKQVPTVASVSVRCLNSPHAERDRHRM